jgi:hypothetical protein
VPPAGPRGTFFFLQVKYADILYTIKNYRMARSYYSKAVEASQGRSARAMFGILSCYANIKENVGG